MCFYFEIPLPVVHYSHLHMGKWDNNGGDVAMFNLLKKKITITAGTYCTSQKTDNNDKNKNGIINAWAEEEGLLIHSLGTKCISDDIS